jgi:hypothetical protein
MNDMTLDGVLSDASVLDDHHDDNGDQNGGERQLDEIFAELGSHLSSRSIASRRILIRDNVVAE